jgi:hypothetical protein
MAYTQPTGTYKHAPGSSPGLRASSGGVRRGSEGDVQPTPLSQTADRVQTVVTTTVTPGGSWGLRPVAQPSPPQQTNGEADTTDTATPGASRGLRAAAIQPSPQGSEQGNPLPRVMTSRASDRTTIPLRPDFHRLG